MMKIEEEKSKETNENEYKRYTIDMKIVHIYCYPLAIKDDTNIYKAITETAPSDKGIMLIWLEDFNFPKEEIENIKIEMYFTSKNIDCIFKYGNRVKN